MRLQQTAQASELRVIFDNTTQGHAVNDAVNLQRLRALDASQRADTTLSG